MFLTMICFVIATLSLSKESLLYGFVVTFFMIVGFYEIFLPFTTSGLFPLMEYHEDKDNIVW